MKNLISINENNAFEIDNAAGLAENTKPKNPEKLESPAKPEQVEIKIMDE